MTANALWTPRIECPADAVDVINNGLGVDSGVVLAAGFESGTYRPENTIVITAIVGPEDEYEDIRHQTEAYIYPMLADLGVRTVQVARNGPKASDGYSVLSDTRKPKHLVPELATWSLSRHMLQAGTIPQVSSTNRFCSDLAKHWVLDTWIRDNLRGRRYRHTLGFSADEQVRIGPDNAKATAQRLPFHPLADWGLTREMCQAYLEITYGQRFVRSCCGFCPFQYNADNLDTLAERWAAEPERGATALEMEYSALRLNENAYLFGTTKKSSARTFAVDRGLHAALALADARIADSPWAVYDVGRIIPESSKKPGKAGRVWRSVTPLETGTRRAAENALHRLARECSVPLEQDRNGFPRAALSRRGEGFPATERYLVAGPVRAIDKRRDGYYAVWDEVHPGHGIDLGEVARYPQRPATVPEPAREAALCSAS